MAFHSLGITLNLKTFVYQGNNRAKSDLYNRRMYSQISSMTNRWGNSVRLYFWGAPKITADGDCSHEIKKHLLLGRKVMTNLDSILKSRDITLPTKV